VRVSENGAPIQTGRGLEETKRRIVDAFEKIRSHPAQHPAQQKPPISQPPLVYTEEHKTRFHERAKRLSLAALEGSHIMTAKRSHVFEIAVPSESASGRVNQGGVGRMSETKMGPTEMLAEVERVKAAGKFPTLEELLTVVAEVRQEYVPKILAARKRRRSVGNQGN